MFAFVVLFMERLPLKTSVNPLPLVLTRLNDLSAVRYGARRHMSTTSSSAPPGGQDVEHSTRGASERRRQAPSPSPPLQKLLGFSDEQSETTGTKKGTTKLDFRDIDSAGARNGTGRDGAGVFSADDGVKAESPQPLPFSSFPSFLLYELLVEPEDLLSLMSRRPAVSGWSAEDAKKVSQWLQESLEMRQDDAAKLLLLNPDAGTKSVEKVERQVK